MSELEKKNTKLAVVLALVAISMFGFAYVMADTFKWFCEKIGIIRTPDNTERQVNVSFITLVDDAAPVKFWVEKDKQQLTVQPDNKRHRVNFYVENKTDRTLMTRAVPSFSPAATVAFFEKLECFCFSQQELKPHEIKTMPMEFRVTSNLPAQYKTITLSYTFFDNTDKSQ